MNFSELKSSLSDVKKIYLLEGEDAFFRTRGEEMIKKKFLSEPDFNLTNIDASALKTSVDELLNTVSMCPFMSDYRVITINEWYPTLTDFKNKQLSEFFNSEINGTIVIISNKSKCDALKKQKSVCVVDCKKGDIALITKYLQNECKKQNIIISRLSCELLAEFCQFDMNRISMEIAKLISYAAGDFEITEKMINELVAKETDYKVYEAVNFIAEKNYDKAYEVLKEMSDGGSGQMLLVSLYYHFRRLLHVSLSDKPNSELAQLLGVKEYAIKKAKEQARAFSPKRLMRITQKLTEYDAGFKSGVISLDNATFNSVFTILTEK